MWRGTTCVGEGGGCNGAGVLQGCAGGRAVRLGWAGAKPSCSLTETDAEVRQQVACCGGQGRWAVCQQ